MQLRLQRSQRLRGIASSTIYFCLDMRADYSPEERDNINRYKLGGQVIYNSRAAQRHLEAADAHLDRTQDGPAGNRLAGLVRGATSLALAKMQLSITIASLGRGHHVECKDLEELLESEDTIRTACKNVTRFLEVAATFDGSEVVVEYVNGEEKVHIAESTRPLLLEHMPESGSAANAISPDATLSESRTTSFDVEQVGQFVRRHWAEFRAFDLRVQTALGLGMGLALLLLLRACS